MSMLFGLLLFVALCGYAWLFGKPSGVDGRGKP